jgi:hypothetical protein
MSIKLILKGIGSYIPGVAAFRANGTGGTGSARYCYAVWLRHLVMAHRNDLCQKPPRTVLELGPGDTLGTGLASLLTGAEKYYALDVVRHSSIQRSLVVLEELAALFRSQENIPSEKEFPRLKPVLDSYEFPSHIIASEDLARLLDEKRIERLKQSVLEMNKPDSMVSYVAGSYGPGTIPPESVDMVFSQAVLEYVEPLVETHRLMNLWLRPDGFVSHQIDFGCHGLAEDWNGHWSYSDLLWKLIRGKRACFISRAPHSTHMRSLEQAGFHVVCDLKVQGMAARGELRLAPRFADLSPEDRTTRSAFIQARKCRGVENGSHWA